MKNADEHNYGRLCDLSGLQTRIEREENALSWDGKREGSRLIQWVLDKTGWTKSELAKRLGVTNVWLSYLLHGKRGDVSLSFIKRLANVYGDWEEPK
jgi:antitoxin component HigA of HigAB toxin-antitoxin module